MNGNFILLAQQVDLQNLSAPQTLQGHIVKSEVGKYEPSNVVIKAAKFRVDRVLLNVANPFFKEE